MEKSNKPIIGIISKPNVFCDDELYTQQITYDGIRCAILKNDGIVIGILPTQPINKFCNTDELDKTKLTEQELKDLYQLVDLCDGIILEGGLSSASYEVEVAKYAIRNDIPLLGICAGFNNIIRAMGGNTFLIKNNEKHNKEDGQYAHKNIVQKNSLLYNILNKEEIKVNSIHTMFAMQENVENLEISSFSDDGYVEAVELKNNKFCLGLKWHPELMLDYDKNMNKIFQRFLEVCKNTDKIEKKEE